MNRTKMLIYLPITRFTYNSIKNNRKFIYSFNPSKMCKHHCVCHSKNIVIDDFLSIDEEHLPFI